MTTNHLSNGERSSLLALRLSNHSHGQVDSIFRHSFNITFPNLLVHVGRIRESLSCLGVTLPDEEVMQLISKISIGDVVRLINGNLYIYTQRQVLNLPVCQLTEINLRVMKKALTLSEQEIQGVFESLDFENNWGLSTNHPAQLMQRFLQAQSEEEVEKVVYYLMGRGKGLTPSGDDMLVGLMTTLGTFRPNAQSTWRMVINHRMAEQVTTNVSQAYLAASVDGFASKKLLDLMQALHMGDAREINLAVIAMKNFGHTSGMDTLFGIFCGLKLALLS